MKCLVTGSEGFIGKNLVARLEEDGHEVVGFDLKKGAHQNYLGVPEWDQEFDVVFHLACINQMQALDDPAANLLYNAQGTRILANWAAETGAKFIYTSTASVYGNAEQIPTPVDAKLQPLTDYAVAKLAGEFFVQNSGADWTILRLSNVYGPHQTLENPYCGVIGRFFEQARKGEPLTIIGDGQQTRDFTYVGDVVNVLAKIAESGFERQNHIFNFSYGKETSIEQLAGMIARAYGTKTEIEWIGRRPIDGIHRRCLKSNGFTGYTPLEDWYGASLEMSSPGGISLTKEWFDEFS